MRGDIHNIDDGLKYFGQGALTGAALGAAWQFTPVVLRFGQSVQNVMSGYAIRWLAYGRIGISPAFGLGASGLTGGINTSAYYRNGNLSIGGSLGEGQNYWGWNASATYRGWGAGYGQTSYAASQVMGHQLSDQKVGTYTAFFNHNSFSLSNDLFGDKEDRWRTSAAELTIGKWSIGTYLYTNDGAEASDRQLDKSPGGIAPWPVGIKKNTKLQTWTNGRPYFAPFWVGYRQGNQITRFGFSHQTVHNLTQNMVHKYMSTPYYMNYENFRTGGYFYTGYRNPLSLWDY